MKYKHCVIGLILVSPLCQAPSWTEWLLNKVTSCLYLDSYRLDSTYTCSSSILKSELYAGVVKPTLLLWHVWSGKRITGKEVF